MAIKILLADDSLTIQKVVELTFSDAETQLMAVGSGDRAVQALDDFQPDIVLADVVMPGLTGYEVCEAVKARPGGAFVPVVLLTGTFEPFDRGRADRVGSDAIVTKPFDSHALQGLVRELVEKAAAAREAAASAPSPEATVPAPTLNLSTEEMEDAFPLPASPAQDTGATQVLTLIDLEELAPPPFAEAATSAPEGESIYRTVAMKIPTEEEMTLAAENEGLAVPPPQEPEAELEPPAPFEPELALATEPPLPPPAFYEPGVAYEASPPPPPPPHPPAFLEPEPEVATEPPPPPPAFYEPEVAFEPPPPPPAFFEPEPEIATEPPPPPPPPTFYEPEVAFEPPPPPPPPAFYEPEIAFEPPPPPPPAFFEPEPEVAMEPPPSPSAFYEPASEPEVATEPPPPPAFYEPEVAYEPPPAFYEPEPEVATEPSEPLPVPAEVDPERTAPVRAAPPEAPAFDLSPEEAVVAVEEQVVEPFPEMDEPAPAPESGSPPWDEEPAVEIPPPPPQLAGSQEEGEYAEPITRDIEADLEAFESSGRVRRRPEIWERHAALIGEEVPADIDVGEAPPAQESAALEPAEPFPSELEEIAAAARLEDLSKMIPSTPQAPRPAKEREVGAAAPAETTLPMGGGAPLSLKDADVDRIARRVVELLSDKTVRDIAWEVVPEYAERLVRERISEVERAG